MRTTPLTYDEALHKAAAYCSQSEHCTSELMEKFKFWGVDYEYREKIVQFLVRENYMDEKRFAAAFVKDKFRFNKWGKIKIRLELKTRKIDDAIIEDALSQVRDKEYKQMILKLLKEKEKIITFRNQYEKNGKLYNYLAGKGFEGDVINQVIGND